MKLLHLFFLFQGLAIAAGKSIPTLIEELNEESFDVREEATEKLLALGPKIHPELLARFYGEGPLTLEQRNRLARILKGASIPRHYVYQQLLRVAEQLASQGQSEILGLITLVRAKLLHNPNLLERIKKLQKEAIEYNLEMEKRKYQDPEEKLTPQMNRIRKEEEEVLRELREIFRAPLQFRGKEGLLQFRSGFRAHSTTNGRPTLGHFHPIGATFDFGRGFSSPPFLALNAEGVEGIGPITGTLAAGVGLGIEEAKIAKPRGITPYDVYQGGTRLPWKGEPTPVLFQRVAPEGAIYGQIPKTLVNGYF